MEIVKQLIRDSNLSHWRDGLEWFWWSVFGLLPVGVTILMLHLYKQPISLSIFTNNGEFALYSASYLGGTLYIVMKDFKDKTFPSRSLLTPILVGLLVLAAILFAQVALINFLAGSDFRLVLPELDKDVVRNISIVLLPSVIFLSLIVVVADNMRLSIDVNQISRKQYDALNDQFDDLEDDNNE